MLIFLNFDKIEKNGVNARKKHTIYKCWMKTKMRNEWFFRMLNSKDILNEWIGFLSFCSFRCLFFHKFKKTFTHDIENWGKGERRSSEQISTIILNIAQLVSSMWKWKSVETVFNPWKVSKSKYPRHLHTGRDNWPFIFQNFINAFISYHEGLTKRGRSDVVKSKKSIDFPFFNNWNDFWDNYIK